MDRGRMVLAAVESIREHCSPETVREVEHLTGVTILEDTTYDVEVGIPSQTPTLLGSSSGGWGGSGGWGQTCRRGRSKRRGYPVNDCGVWICVS